MSMILLEPANKITHANVGDQAADHLSNTVFWKPQTWIELSVCSVYSDGYAWTQVCCCSVRRNGAFGRW